MSLLRADLYVTRAKGGRNKKFAGRSHHVRHRSPKRYLVADIYRGERIWGPYEGLYTFQAGRTRSQQRDIYSLPGGLAPTCHRAVPGSPKVICAGYCRGGDAASAVAGAIRASLGEGSH